MNFELPDLMDPEEHPQDITNIVLVDRPAEAIQASEQPIMAATPAAATGRTGSSRSGNGVPAGHPPVSAGANAQTSCPFAALSMALEMGGGELPSPKKDDKKDDPSGKKDSGLGGLGPGFGGSLNNKSLGKLPTINQNSAAVFDEEDGEEEQKGITATCPMTGGKMQLGRQSSQGSQLSAGGSKIGVKKAPSLSGSRGASESQMSSSKSKKKDSGGGRRTRRVGRKSKPPAFNEEEAAKYAPIIRNSWSRIMELKGYFELGMLYYDTLFDMTPELRHLFTLDRSEMGVKFVDMLASMVSDIDSPPKLHQKLEDLSPMHIRKGVQAGYMPQMGAVLFAVLQAGLGDEFNQEAKEAWGWIWEWLTKSMALTLAGAGNHSSLVIMSWDMALENYDEEELGGMLYDTIIKTAPNLKSIFSKPRQVMAMKFCDMISTIVSFADDPERMKQQLSWLGVRHVKYGAKPHHVSIVGQILVSTLEEAVGEEWTPEMEKAWVDLWNASCDAMMDAIKDAETHGEVVEEVWSGVKKKAKPSRLGSLIVNKLIKLHPELVVNFTNNYKAKKQKDEESKKEGKSTETLAAAVSDSDEQPGCTACGKGKYLSKFSKRSKPDEGVGLDKSGDASMNDLKLSLKVDASGARDLDRDEADEAFGMEMWTLLETVMTLLWEPEQMNERLIVLGNRFFHFGLRLAHLEGVCDAIHESLKVALAAPCGDCGKHEWKSQVSDAWAWVWQTACQSMIEAIESAEQDHPALAKKSWEEIKKRRTPEQIGDSLFTELTREAPHVVHLFKRPKKLQSFMFMQAVDTLVFFASEPGDFFDDLRTFTIRHIKYGVKSEYVKPFGKALLQGLEELAGDSWSEDAKSAWYSVWIRLSSCVARSLNNGTNLITVSLVNGDLERMQEAAECAPRGERISWLTRVEVNGTEMSPLYWAIRDGKFSIAKFMLEDLLAIRADRECYYYGRTTLFEKHPDLIYVLCKDCPELVRVVFDGLLWHSQTVLDGRLRVNYYVKELYADPEETPDAWKSPLAVLCNNGTPDMFNHPVLEKLLELKWNRFGQIRFLALQAFFVVMIGLFTTGSLKYGCDCSPLMIGIRLATGSLAAVAWLFMAYIMVRQLMLGQIGKMSFLSLDFPVPRLMMNPWNVIRFICMTTTGITEFNEICWRIDDSTSRRKLACLEQAARRAGDGDVDYHHAVSWDMVLLSVSALLLWGQLIQVLMVSQQLGTLSFAVGRLFIQVGRNLVIVAVLLVSFACGLTALQEPAFEDIDVSIIDLLRITFGLNNEGMIMLENWGLLLLVLFSIIVHLGMFSIVIAQVVKGYDDLAHVQEGQSKMTRAFQCVEVESFLPMKTRKQFYDELNLEQPIEFDNGDEGPAGGVQCMELAAVRATEFYVPDRIQRFTGNASALDAWPRTIRIGGRDPEDLQQ